MVTYTYPVVYGWILFQRLLGRRFIVSFEHVWALSIDSHVFERRSVGDKSNTRLNIDNNNSPSKTRQLV